MLKFLIVFLFLTTIILAKNTTNTTKSIGNPWDTNLVLGLNVSQIAFSNWSKGGENAVTWTGLTDFEIKYKTPV